MAISGNCQVIKGIIKDSIKIDLYEYLSLLQNLLG
jgi:hypothetical protein